MRIGECVTARRSLSGLGQTGPNPFVEYMSSLKRAQAQLDYLEKATPSNWEFRVNDALKAIPNEFKAAEMFVRGKTGNPEAEDQLFKLWGAASKAAIRMNADKPGVMAQLKDKASIFFTDFWQGAKEAQQGYASWAIEHAGPVLKTYHGGLQRMAILRKDLADAKAAGRPAAEIAQQEAKIANAESWANKVRSTFSAISAGASIDKLATDKYGALGFGPIMGAIIFAAILAISEIIMLFVRAALDIRPLAEKALPLIAKIDFAIDQAAKAAGAAGDTARKAQEKFDIIVPVLVGALALIAGGAFYYFVYRKKNQ
jgi:hypothetical protein